MTDDDLRALRETFRREMREHDFCIGEKQVERVFRELLHEPEPPEPVRDPASSHTAMTTAQIDSVLRDYYDNAVLDSGGAGLGDILR